MLMYIRQECPIGPIIHAKSNEGEEDGSEAPGVDPGMIPFLYHLDGPLGM